MRAMEEEKEDAPPVLESPALLTLLEEQKRVESLVSQRRTDIRDSFKSMDRHKRKIRVTVTNTHANQQPPQPQASVSPVPAEPPSWTLAIHGRILDASDPSGALVLAPGAPPPVMQTLSPHGQLITVPSPTPISSISRGHFSDYVRRIEVQLDQALYPGEQGTAVWDRSLQGSLSRDMFEVRRTGSQPSTAKVTIWIDWRPERFKLPLPLATALGTHFETRPRVLQLMAQYVAKNHLPDPKNPGSVRLPLSLAQLLAPEELKQQQDQQQQQPQGPGSITGALLTYEALMERVSLKLEAMPPLEITHDIQLSGPPRAAHAIDVDLDFGAAPLGSPLQDAAQGHSMPGFKQEGPSRPCEKELLLLEEAGQKKEAIAADLSRAERLYNEAKRRRTALYGFVQAPVDFINGLAAAQAKELHVCKGQEKATAYTLHNMQQNRFPGVNPFDHMYHTNASMYATEFECKRRNALFQEPWVEDCILADKVYLSNKTQRSQPHHPMGPPAML